MTKQTVGQAPTSTEHVPHVSSETDDVAGVLQFARGHAEDLQAVGRIVDTEFSFGNAEHPATDGHGGTHAVAGLVPAFDATAHDTTQVTGSIHFADQPHPALLSAADFSDGSHAAFGSTVEALSAGFDHDLNNDLSGPFDRLDNLSLSDGFNTAALDNGLGTPVNHPFDAPNPDLPGLSDVFSDARGGGTHGGGGGGHGGGTTPSAYTTHSGTGVDIHVTYDSSVGSAPTGFVSAVQQVAEFFASAFQHDPTHPITINIDVGYGEVDGMRMGPGALGESVTNLLNVTYSQLASAYSAPDLSDVSLGQAPGSGNLYLSFAEAKALNFSVSNTIDGYVGFSSQSGIFDYNNADGVSAGQYDFFGTVAHEFSEVMGRILLAGGAINGAASYMAYDLFHYASAGVQDFAGNGGYFSTDIGSTILAYFNNASNGGDAGDWASTGTSGSPAGGTVYDAFNAFGTSGHVTPISNTDLLALHAVGFDLAPPIAA